MKTFYLILITILIISCTKSSSYHSTPRNSNIEHFERGDIVINEFSAKAEEKNEFGEKADWVELYNTTDKEIDLSGGLWTITDDLDRKKKFILPDVVIEAKGHLVIWCDGKNTSEKDIHTNFKLSSKGESIALYYDNELMDSFIYTEFSEKSSYGRIKDGHEDWGFQEIASIGMPNKFTE